MSGFLDTNILLYSISTDPAERSKRDVAIGLLERTDNVLSVQVMQEFYVQSTRASRNDALSHDVAVGLVTAWQRFVVVPSTVELLHLALELRGRYHWSYWDAAVVAAAKLAGCTELLTEDLQHGHEVGGLRIVDPFASEQ